LDIILESAYTITAEGARPRYATAALTTPLFTFQPGP